MDRNRIVMKAASFSMACAVLLMPAACSSDRDASVQTTKDSAAQTKTAVEGGEGVRLLPESPTVEEDLRVIHSAAKQATYGWYVNGQLAEGERVSLFPRDRFRKGDTVKAEVSLDGKDYSVSALIMNSPPRILSTAFSDPQNKSGNVTVEPEVIDADGDAVRFRFQWRVNGERLPEEGPSVPRTRFRKGDRVEVSVTPFDPEDEGETYTLEPIDIPNSPPRFTSPPMAEFSASGYQYQARAEDPDGDPLTFSLLQAPAGMTIDSGTGVVTWSLDDARAGEHTVEIAVNDPDGLKSTQLYTLTVALPKEVKNE